MDSELLYIDSVEHAFAGKPVLSGVYLQCGLGETVGILGRNGSGKSTLLNILFGSLCARYKYQKIDGKVIQSAFSTGKVVMLPQRRFIPLKLTVRSAVNLFVHTHKATLLQLEFINRHINNRFSDLSGGERRMIEFLVVLYSDATYILLDEPFSQLAPPIIDEMKMHLKIMKQQKGIVLTDHYYQHVVATADRIVLLHNGSNYTISSEDDLRTHGYLPST